MKSQQQGECPYDSDWLFYNFSIKLPNALNMYCFIYTDFKKPGIPEGHKCDEEFILSLCSVNEILSNEIYLPESISNNPF